MLDYQLGAELDVMWADEIIGNTVAYPGVSLRWCYAACAGASRWRDQIDNPSLEYELLVYRTGTVSEPTQKGLMQGQMLGNTVSTAISQTAYYLKDHIANADTIQGSGDGTCTGSLQSNGCGGYRGGQLCTHDDDDAASLTSSCFNVIMYVGPFAANNYIAPWLEDKERTKVSFKTSANGYPGGLFAPRTEGECLDAETGELLACQLDVSGNPIPYANSSDASGTTPNCVDFSGCAGDNITTVASALRRGTWTRRCRSGTSNVTVFLSGTRTASRRAPMPWAGRSRPLTTPSARAFKIGRTATPRAASRIGPPTR